MLTTSSRTSVLSTDSDLPPMTKTTMGTNLLHSLNIITKLGRDILRKDLGVLSRLPILLPIQKPQRNLELTRVLDNRDNLFNLISSQFTSALVHVNFGLFADKVGESASETINLGEAKDDIAVSFHVGIENTQNVLEFRSLHQRSRTPVGVGAGVSIKCMVWLVGQQ